MHCQELPEAEGIYTECSRRPEKETQETSARAKAQAIAFAKFCRPYNNYLLMGETANK